MTAYLVSILCTLTHIPSLVYRYIPFKNKVTKKQRLILMIIYTVALISNFALCLFLAVGQNLTITFFKANLLLFCMLMCVVNMIVIKGYNKEHLFAFGLTAIIVLMLFSISSFITDKLNLQNLAVRLAVCSLFLIVLFILTYLPFAHLMKATITPSLDFKDQSYWNTIWFIPVCMLFATLLSNPANSYVSTPTQLAGRILVGVATLFVCFSIAPDYQRLLENEKLNHQIWLQKQYYAALTEKVSSEREARHNFKHQIAAIRGYLAADDKEGLTHYCEEMESYHIAGEIIPYTGNAAADGVLYHYSSLAKAAHIRFEAHCSLDAVNLPDIELCTLLGNALDNAVTACTNYDGDRYIRVASEINNHLLIITIDNSFNGRLQIEGDKILSGKREHEEGIGIASMKKVCADHGGTSRFTAKDNHFEASFLLQI